MILGTAILAGSSSLFRWACTYRIANFSLGGPDIGKGPAGPWLAPYEPPAHRVGGSSNSVKSGPVSPTADGEDTPIFDAVPIEKAFPAIISRARPSLLYRLKGSLAELFRDER